MPSLVERSGEQGAAMGEAKTTAAPARTEEKAVGRTRTWALFTIVESNDRAVWRRVGSGFENRDGSFNLYLEALPLNGKLHMREV